MKIFNWYKKVVFENYVNFKGRARRSEYWYFTMFTTIFLLLGFYIDNLLGLNFEQETGGPFYLIVLLGSILPGLAVTVRRMHDQNKSGWFVLVCFVPCIGSLWLLILLVTEGTLGKNSFGEDPKRPYDEINDIGLE